MNRIYLVLALVFINLESHIILKNSSPEIIWFLNYGRFQYSYRLMPGESMTVKFKGGNLIVKDSAYTPLTESLKATDQSTYIFTDLGIIKQ
ncbi:hypothetical protein A3F66_03180 [candidate division TM6 bacterium RIFCSPHIGHO2_12_FULL_32_22]|nr:MAG: hypothetical protein A3F66_03180 [candidate division TM6 bacterium RIFCSPHIGHO2_12_FULL_32_22]